MNRRGFLKLATLAALGATVDPDRLLWTPGARTFVLPPPQGWRPGLVFHPDVFFLAMARLNDAQREYNIWASNQAEMVSLPVTGGAPLSLSHYAVRETAQALADRIDLDGLRLYERVYSNSDGGHELSVVSDGKSVVYLDRDGIHVAPRWVDGPGGNGDRRVFRRGLRRV